MCYVDVLQGGLPAWLLTENPNVKVRTSDPSEYASLKMTKSQNTKIVDFANSIIMSFLLVS